MGVLSFLYLLLSLRTDLAHVSLFFGLTMTFGFLAGADWQLASGRESLGHGLTVAGGAWGLLATLPGWYMFVSILGDAMEWPFRLPRKFCDFLRCLF